MSKVKLKPGDYVAIRGLPAVQIKAVADAFIDAGAIAGARYPFAVSHTDWAYMGWDSATNSIMRAHEWGLRARGMDRQHTVGQVLGSHAAQEPATDPGTATAEPGEDMSQ